MFTFRPLVTWPYPKTPNWERRSRDTFKVGWQETMNSLEYEIGRIDGERVVIQADFDESQIRIDGMPYANARHRGFPGVIVSFESKVGPLQYATDLHELWQHNVRAIALGLEALRAVDRYGITRANEQYQGWKQLNPGTGLTTADDARRVIERLSGQEIDPGFGNLHRLYRYALKKAHPDGGGTTELLQSVQAAGRVLGVRG